MLFILFMFFFIYLIEESILINILKFYGYTSSILFGLIDKYFSLFHIIILHGIFTFIIYISRILFEIYHT